MLTNEFVHESTVLSSILGRNSKVNVVFEGDQAYTDGNTVVVPSLPQEVELSKEQQMVLRGYIDHEAGHVRHTDFSVLEREKPNGLLHMIWNSIEDMWLERKVINEYPGAEKNIKAVSKDISAKEIEHMDSKPKVSDLDLIGLGIRTYGRRNYFGGDYDKLLSFVPKNIQKFLPTWDEEIHKCTSTEDTCALAKKIVSYFKNEDPEMEGTPEQFLNHETGDFELTEEEESKSKIMVDVKELVSGLGKIIGKGKSNKYLVASTREDEWITKKNPKAGLDKGSLSGYESVKTAISAQVNVMKNKLRNALLAKERRDWDRGRLEGKLDSKRLAAAFNFSPTVYKQRTDRFEHDTAVTLLVDCSGSMDGSKIELAEQTAIAMCECLEVTGIKYNVLGFTCWDASDVKGKYHRREGLKTYEFKGFDDPLNNSKRFINAITRVCTRNNADRDSILEAYYPLVRRQEKRKILIVLSDGHPAYECDFSSTDVYGWTKKAVDFVSKKVECVGIGIMSRAVKEFYPRHVVVEDVSSLGQVVTKELTRLLVGGRW